MHFSDEQVQRAREVSLLDFIRSNEGWTILNVGNFYTTKEHDSLRILSDEKTFFWNSRGLNGHNVIDWLQKTRNMTFAESVRLILGEDGEKHYEKAKETVPIKEKKKISLPLSADSIDRTWNYLLNDRRIDIEILQYVLSETLIYQSIYNDVVFLGYDENGEVRFAESHTTETGSPNRPKNITGSDKKYSFHIDNKNSDTLYVFEAPIDLLSHCSLYLMKERLLAEKESRNINFFAFSSVNRLSLSGANSKTALEGYLERNTHIKKLVFALDNDKVGMENAEKYMKQYSETGYDCKIIILPENCKDWNEYLQHLHTLEKSVMDNEVLAFTEKEMTVQNEPIGVGSEQPLKNESNDIITENNANCKASVKNNPKLSTLSMNELYNCVYAKKPPVIDNLLYTGTYLFVGAPKLGKSFFMAQLAYHVSTGTPLWNYAVRQGTVLYLALEDDYSRLQERLYRMFGTEGTDKLHFATSAQQLNKGLEEQIIDFLKEYDDTNLIIIDTLQKVREVENEAYSYANDYEVITKLKKIADEYGFCLLLVHHTRKQQSNDKFDMISGTNGLLGAADGAFLLHKEKRTSKSAILEVSGRDQQDQKLTLNRNTEKLIWELEKAETELWKTPPEPLLEAIGKFINENNPTWEGTATELLEKLDLDFEIQANALTKKLNVTSSRLYNEYYIQYSTKRTHNGRMIYLSFDENHPILIQPEIDTASPESDTDTNDECRYKPYKDYPNISYFEIKGEGHNKSFEEMTPEEKENFILTSY